MKIKEEEIVVRYKENPSAQSGIKYDGVKLKTIKGKVNELGLMFQGDKTFVVIYSAPTIELARDFYKLFFTPNMVADRSSNVKTYSHPYVLEQDGIIHLVIRESDFNRVYRRELQRIMKTVLNYMIHVTVKQSIFEKYTYFVYTWKSHYYVDKILKEGDIDVLRKAVLHYSQPENLNIVSTRRIVQDGEETTEEKRKEKFKKANESLHKINKANRASKDRQKQKGI